MLDNDVMRILIATTNEILIENNITNFVVVQAFQKSPQNPTKNGVVMIQKVSTQNISVGKYGTYNAHSKKSVYQFDCLNPSNSPLPSDVLTIIADNFQDSYYISKLVESNINIERVTNFRNSFILNDKNQYESTPSFDLPVIHTHDYTRAIENVTAVTGSEQLI